MRQSEESASGSKIDRTPGLWDNKILDVIRLISNRRSGMVEKKTIDIVLRPKRQVTLPREVCDELGIGPGDVLEVSVEDARLVARPKKTAAMEALKEIQKAFERSGITEEELQEAARRAREEIARGRFDAGA
ncbi:MAG TPA: AbrB/MazE/SpoVT family DNA-binding domain-containing protein [Anaerolineae bacterium]|nr:AbrB/MazE/SpoVT family DNA-binding domain-containing protein [Anaerolineae bacterium]